MSLIIINKINLVDNNKDKYFKIKDTKKAEPKKEEAKGPLKKDGTPDKRYKANKETKKEEPKGPLKKDGTPDKRYKANKEAKK